MNLSEALGVVRGDVISLIGAGGKTSLLIGLGYELAEASWRVLATSTVDIDSQQLEVMPRALPVAAGLDAISVALTEDRFVFLYRSIQRGKVHGLSPAEITRLLDGVDSDVLLIEADCADNLPLKAPFSDEPQIPPETSLVIPLVSMSVLGQPLDSDHVYNADAIIERYGFSRGAPVKSAWVAQVLRDEVLGLRGVPDDVRVISFINQSIPKGYGRGRARMIARLVLRSPRVHGVVVGSVRAAEPVYEVQRPVGAVVLAAGLSTRMGQPKVLLPWSGRRTIIEHIIDQLIKSRLDHITLVTGHHAKEVKQVVKPLAVNVVYNRAYKTGEMLSSLQAGLRALPENIAAALVVLGDQPSIQPKVIYQLLNAYAEGKGDLIVPSFERRRGHPVLIGRRYWPELLSMPTTITLRDFFNTYNDRIAYVTVDNDSILRDVDTPHDYQQERWRQ